MNRLEQIDSSLYRVVGLAKGAGSGDSEYFVVAYPDGAEYTAIRHNTTMAEDEDTPFGFIEASVFDLQIRNLHEDARNNKHTKPLLPASEIRGEIYRVLRKLGCFREYSEQQ